MDPNQSLTYDYNLTFQYITELGREKNIRPIYYQVTAPYRTPSNVNKLANNILENKSQKLGGVLGGKKLSQKDPVDSPKELGYIRWITHNKTKEDIASSDLSKLQREAANGSIYLAIIIPDKSMKEYAEEIFPGSIMIFTPEETRGLEFPKVVLFNFFSGDYPSNYFNNRKTELLSSHPEYCGASLHYPKDSVKAKENTKYCSIYNSLYIAITRTTNDLYFFEEKETAVIEKYKEMVLQYAGKGKKSELDV